MSETAIDIPIGTVVRLKGELKSPDMIVNRRMGNAAERQNALLECIWFDKTEFHRAEIAIGCLEIVT